jgi:uncharacterized protein with beta-barrel porin domain
MRVAVKRSVAAVWIGVSGSALLATAPALAGSFTIGPGASATATQTLGTGETGLIEAGGTIDTTGTAGPGVSGLNSNSVTNHGEVKARTDGIAVLDGNAITNSGTIASSSLQVVGADGYDGIQAQDNNVIVNSGGITGIDDGIDVRDGNVITNTGSIQATDFTSWDGVWGITARNNNRIYNEAGGEIVSRQSEVELGANNYVRNAGTVGDTPWGTAIWAYESNTMVVTATGTVVGKIMALSSNTITNSGSIGSLEIYNSNTVRNHGTLGGITVSTGTENVIENTGTIGRGGILVLSYAGLQNTIANTGTIKGDFDGVYIRDGGTLKVTGATGRIEAERNGIRAYDSRDAPLVITSAGAIFAKQDGIYAVSGPSYAGSTAAMTITSTGSIHSVNARGIYVRTLAMAAAPLTIVSGGAVKAALEGIFAYSEHGSAKLDIGGSVTSETRAAVRAMTGSGAVVSVTGTVTGAAGFAGVDFGTITVAGVVNTLAVASGGVVNNAGGLSQLAVLGASGNEAVSNAGTVSGNVDLGTGSNSFTNNAGGVFNMGASVNLGGGALSNSGTLSPGGNGAVAGVALTGNLVQSAGGVMAVDVDPATGGADLITVTGSASLAGQMALSLPYLPTVSQRFTILSAAGGVTDNGLALAVDPSTVARRLTLAYPNANDVVLDVTVDFSARGLNANQRRLGDNLNGLAGAGGMAPLLDTLIEINDLAEYRDALNQLSPEAYLQAAMSGVFSAQAFADVLMSCREREGTYAYIAQGQCLWMDAGGGHLSLDQTGDQLDSDQASWWLGGGGQFAVSDTVHAGLGLRYEHVSQDVGSDAHNDGSWGHIGTSVKYTPGAWLLGAGLSGGKCWIGTDRNIGIGAVSGQAEGDQDLGYVHGKLRAAYLFDMGQWYAKPILDLDATWLSYGDVSEDGGGGAGLDIDGGNDTVLSATPRLEVGGQMEMENGALVRPYLQAGVTFYGDTGLSVDSAFLDAPGGSPAFVTETEIDSVLADISVGLDVLAVENLNVRLSYDGLFGSNTMSNAGTLRLEWRL